MFIIMFVIMFSWLVTEKLFNCQPLIKHTVKFMTHSSGPNLKYITKSLISGHQTQLGLGDIYIPDKKKKKGCASLLISTVSI